MTLLFPLALASLAPNRNSPFPTDLAPHGPAPSSSSRSQPSPSSPAAAATCPFFLRPSFHLPFFSHLPHPYPIKTHTSRWLVHGSENRTLTRRKRSCRRFPATKVRRKRSKSARLSSVLTSFIALYLIPHGFCNRNDVSLQSPAVALADATRLCKSIWQAYVAMRVTRAPLEGRQRANLSLQWCDAMANVSCVQI